MRRSTSSCGVFLEKINEQRLQSPTGGDRLERALVRLLAQHGTVSARMLQSGAKGGHFRGDLVLPLFRRELIVEVKHHGSSFKRHYD